MARVTTPPKINTEKSVFFLNGFQGVVYMFCLSKSTNKILQFAKLHLHLIDPSIR